VLRTTLPRITRSAPFPLVSSRGARSCRELVSLPIITSEETHKTHDIGLGLWPLYLLYLMRWCTCSLYRDVRPLRGKTGICPHNPNQSYLTVGTARWSVHACRDASQTISPDLWTDRQHGCTAAARQLGRRPADVPLPCGHGPRARAPVFSPTLRLRAPLRRGLLACRSPASSVALAHRHGEKVCARADLSIALTPWPSSIHCLHHGICQPVHLLQTPAGTILHLHGSRLFKASSYSLLLYEFFFSSRRFLILPPSFFI
jgi:hypothetical protein